MSGALQRAAVLWQLLGSQEGGWGGRAHQELGRCSVPPLKVSSLTVKMPGNATFEKKMEVSPNSTLGACKAVPVAAAWVVLVRLKGLNEVRTKLSVKEYAVMYFCKVIFFLIFKKPNQTKKTTEKNSNTKPRTIVSQELSFWFCY